MNELKKRKKREQKRKEGVRVNTTKKWEGQERERKNKIYNLEEKEKRSIKTNEKVTLEVYQKEI